ncbi:MAG: hypothetical protein MZU91_00515 [Desulfosudis oleivorans]|nr:hypothetical protein [Desulfosudis oleivorans]
MTEYWPTLAETSITLGVWGIGFLVLTILYKIAVSIKEETAPPPEMDTGEHRSSIAVLV